jgi:hypothetical protein
LNGAAGPPRPPTPEKRDGARRWAEGRRGAALEGGKKKRTGFLCNLSYKSTFRSVIEFSGVAKEMLQNFKLIYLNYRAP